MKPRVPLLALVLLPACAGAQSPPAAEEAPSPASLAAHVRAVEVTGAPGSYHFSVTVQSPDTGCDRYADWWEVLDGEGTLLYRRILRHSHVGEQPFTRAGGPVEVAADGVVVVRAHLSTTGFGGQVMRGTPADGFAVVTDLPADFAAVVEGLPPRPDACLY